MEILLHQGGEFVAIEVTEENRLELSSKESHFLIFLVVQKGVSITVMSVEDNIPMSLLPGYIAIGLRYPKQLKTNPIFLSSEQ